ncbi:MAG: hypothetical protein QM654_13600 [Dysgonamonadaceae bacterium]
MKQILLITLALLAVLIPGYSQQAGDTVTVGNIKYVLKGNNLIANPGFENGFTGWTDATSSASQLSSSNFTIYDEGGIGNSKYLVGTANSNSSSAGSIGTGWNIESGKTYYFCYNVKYQDATASTGSEIYLKTSLTNDKTNSLEPSVLITSSKVNGNGEWTLNSTAFTNDTPYSYLVVRFRWLNSRFGFDNFALYEAFEMPDITGLKATIAEAESLYNTSAVGAETFLSAINSAKTYLNSESVSQVKDAITVLEKEIFKFKTYNASPENPLDLTSYIVNQGFDANNGNGWTGVGTVNYHETEYYQTTFDLNQTIAGLPAGKYILKAQGFERPKGNDGGVAYAAGTETIYAKLYAKSTSFGEKSTALNSLYKHSYSGTGNSNGYVNSMAAAETMLTDASNNYYETSLTEIYVADGDLLTIGAKSDFQQNGYWALLDNFRLYYVGNNISDIIDIVNTSILKAQSLSSTKMQAGIASELNTAIVQAQQAVAANPPVEADIYKVNTRLKLAIDSAEISISAFASLDSTIQLAVSLYGTGAGNEASTLSEAINTAKTISDNLNATRDEISNATLAMEKSIFNYRIANSTGTAPTVVSVNDYARGSTIAFIRGTVSGIASSEIQERGICWSTEHNPTVKDYRYAATGTIGTFLGRAVNLEPATIYYMRPYAISKGYAVGYGDEVKVITINKGNVTYKMESNVTGDNYTRINAAMAEAVNYYNNLTSINGLSLSVNFGSGTPTAEASYGGYMRFGPLVSYQQTGTALHEMGHTIGVGQLSYWTSSSSPLKVNGVWQGVRANKVLQFMTDDATARVKGDYVHFWPYGVNGANEDDGNEMTYTIHSLIIQGFGEDGLPPVSGMLASPAYTFEHKDNVKYYLKNEDTSAGRDDCFLIESPTGGLVYRKMTVAEANANDSTAWYLDFNPSKSYYSIKNVATGKYITYKYNANNGISMSAVTSPLNTNYFQFMPSRTTTVVGSGNNAVSIRPYWIIYPTGATPPTFAARASTGGTGATTFDIQDTATLQRWLILSQEEAEKLEQAVELSSIGESSASNVNIFASDNKICVENITEPSEIRIYDLFGQQYVHTSKITGAYTAKLQKGLYVVLVRSGLYEDKKKVIITK